jgi:hypothetical protein
MVVCIRSRVDAKRTRTSAYYVVGMRRSLASPRLALVAASAFTFLSSDALAQASSEPRTRELDRHSVTILEHDWLAHLRDSATLERILAPDFLHAFEPGRFLTKRQHISWNVKHPFPPDHEAHFERLQVQLYGDVAVASGIAVSSDGADHIARTLFTDVFAFRDEHWQAVHAQETSLPPEPSPIP